MSSDILQRFLSRKLLDIGGDDTRLERVRKAAEELCGGLLANPKVAARYALVAFDPEVPPTEPVLTDVATVVEKHWNTYASCFADVPRTLFRAVLLEAIRQAIDQHDGIAAAVALMARNVLPHLELKGEQGVWKDLIELADARLEERAGAEWDLSTELNLPENPRNETSKPTTVTAPKVDVGALTQGFAAAAGQRNEQGQPLSGANRYWPGHNEPWVNEFVPRAANAVAQAVDTVLKGAVVKQTTERFAFERIRELFAAISTAVSQATQATQRRLQLLWWKESLYSPSARTNYRNLPTATAAGLMALDLHEQVPTFCPPSVDCFLRETVRSVVGAASEVKPLQSLVSELLTSEAIEPLRASLAKFRQTEGRGLLVSLLAGVSEGVPLTTDRFRQTLGLGESVQSSLPELAVWIFRELQVARALENKEQTPQRETAS